MTEPPKPGFFHMNGLAPLRPIDAPAVDAHPVAGAQVRNIVLTDDISSAIVISHGAAERFVGPARAILDLVARHRAADTAGNRRRRLAPAAADLVPYQTARDAADNRSC